MTTKSNTDVPANKAPTELKDLETDGTQMSVFSAGGFALVQRMAKAFASSSLVPKHYQGEAGIANCIIALNMAQRIGSDPLMTMQSLYIVHGNPGWSSQFLIATFNSCGRFASIRFEFTGEPNTDAWGCRAVSTELSTGERIQGSEVTIAMAKSEGWYSKSGSKWKTMPEQMLMYRAAAWFVRAYAPEIAMGLSTADELQDMQNPTPAATKARVIDDEPLMAEAPADGKLFGTESKDGIYAGE